jgi:hypothetical protein
MIGHQALAGFVRRLDHVLQLFLQQVLQRQVQQGSLERVQWGAWPLDYLVELLIQTKVHEALHL